MRKTFSKNLTNHYYRSFVLSTNLGGQFLQDREQSNFNNRNLGRFFSFFKPSTTISYYYQKPSGYNINGSITHSKDYRIPTIDDLFPVIDSANLYSFNYGNAFLKSSRINNFNFMFNFNRVNSKNKKADVNFFVYGNFGIVNDDIADSSYYDDLGRKNVYLINIDGRKNWNVGSNFNTSFRIKKNVLQFTYNGTVLSSFSPNYINSIFSVSRIQSINNSLRVYFSLGEIVTFSFSQGINMSNSIQTGGNLRSFKNTNYLSTANINLKYPKGFTFSNTFNYVKNSTTKQSSALWNAFVSYRFLRTGQLEAKFSAMDILRQNKNIFIGSSNNTITTSVTNGLKQFFMFTIAYYPRKFGQTK